MVSEELYQYINNQSSYRHTYNIYRYKHEYINVYLNNNHSLKHISLHMKKNVIKFLSRFFKVFTFFPLGGS